MNQECKHAETCNDWRPIESPKDSPKKVSASFRISWIDGDLRPYETKIQGVELIQSDNFGNIFFHGEMVGEVRKLIFVVNAEHLISIIRLDAPVA